MSDDLDNYTELIPACSYCKRIKNPDGSTSPMRALKPNQKLSHGICAECDKTMQQRLDLKQKMENVIKDD